MTSERWSLSPFWQLDRDILHCLYSEWLASWRDLTALDVACVKDGDRDVWIFSLYEARMTKAPAKQLSNKAMIKFYSWLGSRNVLLVEEFPVRISVIVNLLAAFNLETYCPVIRSIEIDRHFNAPIFKVLKRRKLNEKLCSFLERCSRLQSVKVYGENRLHSQIQRMDAVYLLALIDGLNENTLTTIDLSFYTAVPSIDQISSLLINHTSSLNILVLDVDSSMDLLVDGVLTLLLQMRLAMRTLRLGGSSYSIDLLIDYLGFTGMCLETLEMGMGRRRNSEASSNLVLSDRLLVSIGRSCPMLKTLELATSVPLERPSLRKPSQLYQLCPHLKSLRLISWVFSYQCYFSVSLEVNDEKREVVFSDIFTRTTEEKEDWIKFLCDVMAKYQYDISLSEVDGTKYVLGGNEWNLVKANLSPFVTHIHAVLSQNTLLEAVRELSRLEKLNIIGDAVFDDTNLTAIEKYGSKHLKFLSICDHNLTDSRTICRFSDRVIFSMIKSCKLLEVLRISRAGRFGLFAVRFHSRLREVLFENVVESDTSVMESYLQEECQQWPSTLRTGSIVLKDNVFSYMANSRTWKKHQNKGMRPRRI
eukprot:scaffold633_cov288-Ochromonas_danica.AAC.58